MKARLLHKDRDIDWKWVLQSSEAREMHREGRRWPQIVVPKSKLPWNEKALTSDLALTTLLTAMAGEDDCIFEASRMLILSAVASDSEAIAHRQNVLQDCLNNPTVVRDLYAVTRQTMDIQRKFYLGDILATHPNWVLRHGIELMEHYLGVLKALRAIADTHAHSFVSDGWVNLFTMLERNLDDGYLADVRHHLENLKFHKGPELFSAELGQANKGCCYRLHQSPAAEGTWWDWITKLLSHDPTVNGFDLHPRDEAGLQALQELRNRGLAMVANALGQSADHVGEFFGMLRVELAFFVGCINLSEHLKGKSEPICMPVPAPPEERCLSYSGLYDVCLSLTIDERVTGNESNADGKDLIIVTGANTGGKSTFLRSFGLAQLMMQAGMFVPAEKFRSSLCNGLFTHYKREEDALMEKGKFDEELSRMSDIIDHISPHAMILFNESFAATNEREGAEIARQVMTALLEKDIRIICVTHLYELAHGFYASHGERALFLRASRQTDGSRTFRLEEGEPLPTSYGQDLYSRIFGSGDQTGGM